MLDLRLDQEVEGEKGELEIRLGYDGCDNDDDEKEEDCKEDDYDDDEYDDDEKVDEKYEDACILSDGSWPS